MSSNIHFILNKIVQNIKPKVMEVTQDDNKEGQEVANVKNEEDSSKNKEIKIGFSAKNILIKANPTSPNIKEKNDYSTHVNINMNFSVLYVDKSTQTEEIFFTKKWTYFVGLYKIMFPKLDKFGCKCQLKPIKLNIFKNSYSFINKKDNNFLKH